MTQSNAGKLYTLIRCIILKISLLNQNNTNKNLYSPFRTKFLMKLSITLFP